VCVCVYRRIFTVVIGILLYIMLLYIRHNIGLMRFKRLFYVWCFVNRKMASCVRAETCHIEIIKHKITSFSYSYCAKALFVFIIVGCTAENGDYLKMMIYLYACMLVCIDVFMCWCSVCYLPLHFLLRILINRNCNLLL
jgi:hypothetical protein